MTPSPFPLPLLGGEAGAPCSEACKGSGEGVEYEHVIEDRL